MSGLYLQSFLMAPVNVLPLPPDFFLNDLVGNCFHGAFPVIICFGSESLALFLLLLSSSSDDGHFLAAFTDCEVAAAKAENGLCFHALACFPGTPTGLVEAGALPLPHDAPSPGTVPARGTAPPPPTNLNSCFLNFGICLVFILKSEMH